MESRLSGLIQQLMDDLSVSIKEMVLIGHSMGGLVIRSACYYGQEEDITWVNLVSKFITLGSPHYGAPLEKIGSYLDTLLDVIPYTKPLARLGKVRSAGITDLRHGSITDAHIGGNRFKLKDEDVNKVPLPAGINCYAIAATKSKENDHKLSSDGLVSVNSALGMHPDEEKNLKFDPQHTFVCYETKHTQLLTEQKVYNKILDWVQNSN
jgi:pimeloyl-ACP methyl ester carboxylesterase